MCVEGFLLILIVRRHRRIDRSKFLRLSKTEVGTLKKEGGVRAKREKTRVDSIRPSDSELSKLSIKVRWRREMARTARGG